MKILNKIYELKISDLKLWVHLGCSEEEKIFPQQVSINIVFNFITPPNAIVSDEIQDTICYKEIVDSIKILCDSKRFNLIEYLSQEIFNCVKNYLLENKKEARVWVSLKKISPPVPGVFGGVEFNCKETTEIDVSQYSILHDNSNLEYLK